LDRVRRRGVLVARSADLRAALGVPTPNVAIARGLEDPWSDDLVPRDTLAEAMMAGDPLRDGRLHAPRTAHCAEVRATCDDFSSIVSNTADARSRVRLSAL